VPPGIESGRLLISDLDNKKAGYGAIWRGQKSWNGVAILGRDCEPVVTRTKLPGDPEDTQSRYIEAAINGVLIATVYAPNAIRSFCPSEFSSAGVLIFHAHRVSASRRWQSP